MNNPITFQRIEGLALFVAATFVYFDNDFNWVVYLLLLFSFDIFMIGYLANPRIGAVLYNIGHSLTIPSILVVVYLFTDERVVLGLACLWFAHVGFDRAGGYGLKFPTGFKDTHLGAIGKK